MGNNNTTSYTRLSDDEFMKPASPADHTTDDATDDATSEDLIAIERSRQFMIRHVNTVRRIQRFMFYNVNVSIVSFGCVVCEYSDRNFNSPYTSRRSNHMALHIDACWTCCYNCQEALEPMVDSLRVERLYYKLPLHTFTQKVNTTYDACAHCCSRVIGQIRITCDGANEGWVICETCYHYTALAVYWRRACLLRDIISADVRVIIVRHMYTVPDHPITYNMRYC